jgi:hypothetical protein
MAVNYYISIDYSNDSNPTVNKFTWQILIILRCNYSSQYYSTEKRKINSCEGLLYLFGSYYNYHVVGELYS